MYDSFGAFYDALMYDADYKKRTEYLLSFLKNTVKNLLCYWMLLAVLVVFQMSFAKTVSRLSV